MTKLEEYILRRTLAVESAANGMSQDLFKQLQDALSSVTNRVAETSGSFSRMRYERAQLELTGVLAETTKKYSDIIDEQSAKVIQSEYNGMKRQFMSLKKEDLADTPYTLPARQIGVIMSDPLPGGTVTDFIDNNLASVKHRITNEMAQSVILAETVPQAVTRLRNIEGIGRKGALMIARTTFNHVSSKARDEVYEENADIIEDFIFVATLDIRTTLICANYDGTIAKKLADLPSPPLHVLCRSIRVPRTRFDYDDERTRPSIKKESKHIVHHKDGTTSTTWKIEEVDQVPAKTKFKDFLANQPDEWQKQYLGPARYKLYKEGKLRVEDMVVNNRVLSVNDLLSPIEKKPPIVATPEDIIKPKVEPKVKPKIEPMVAAPVPKEVPPPFGKPVTNPRFTTNNLLDAGFTLDRRDDQLATLYNDLIGIPPRDFYKGFGNGLEDKFTLKNVSLYRSGNTFIMNAGLVENGTSLDRFANDVHVIREIFRGANNRKVVDHTILELDPRFRGQGIAKIIARNWMSLYEDIGVRRIKLTAGLEDGSYAWARAGFIPKQEEWDKLRVDISDWLIEQRDTLTRVFTPEEYNYARRLVSEVDPRSIWDLANLERNVAMGRGPDAFSQSIGKWILRDREWSGGMDFDTDIDALAKYKKYIGYKQVAESVLPAPIMKIEEKATWSLVELKNTFNMMTKSKAEEGVTNAQEIYNGIGKALTSIWNKSEFLYEKLANVRQTRRLKLFELKSGPITGSRNAVGAYSYTFANNTRLIELRAPLLKRQRGTLKFGEWSIGQDIETVTTHEYGHYIYHNIITERQKVKVLELFTKFKNQGIIKDKISRYADSTELEMFAEAFAAYLHPEYGDRGLLPKELEDFIKEIVYGGST